MYGYRFDSSIDMKFLLESSGYWSIEKGIKKLTAHSDLTDLDKTLSQEVLVKVNQIKHIVLGLSNGDVTGEQAKNIIVPTITWIKINMARTPNEKIKKHLKELYLMAYSTLNKLEEVGKLAKVGLPGRSGRKAGYKFEETKHPRGGGGKFSSKPSSGAAGVPIGRHVRTSTGRALPSYEIVGGKRVGRGVTDVPSELGPATTRILGHIGSGMAEQALGEPIKAAQMASAAIRGKQARDSAQVEALRQMVHDPRTPDSLKAKAISSLANIRNRRMKETGSMKDPTSSSMFSQRVRAGVSGYAKEIPYSLTVGAIQGALRGMVERFRTNPILAPLDIRVRPDILNSGLRTGMAHLKGKGIERVQDIVARAKSENRPVSVEEYGQISSLLGMTPAERASVVRLATGLEAAYRAPSSESIHQAITIESRLDDLVGHYLANQVKLPHHIPAPALRQTERTKSKANLPVYGFTSKHKEEAQRRLDQLKGKK